LPSHIKVLQVSKSLRKIVNKFSGFDIRPEETALSSVLAPGESQHHQLNTEVNGYPRDVGLMVVEFRYFFIEEFLKK